MNASSPTDLKAAHQPPTGHDAGSNPEVAQPHGSVESRPNPAEYSESIDRLLATIKSGELLRQWASLPALQRIGLRMALRELAAACESLEHAPSAGSESGSAGDELDDASVGYAPPADDDAFPPVDLSTHPRLSTMVRVFGSLPDVERISPQSPAHVIAREQREIARRLVSEVEQIQRQGGVNPEFS
jgi:hypothetical protein